MARSSIVDKARDIAAQRHVEGRKPVVCGFDLGRSERSQILIVNDTGMNSVTDIVVAFGGVTKLGRAIGASPQAVNNMRARDFIPAGYWPALVRSARDAGVKGVTYEGLAQLAEAKRREGVA